jgi:hypothetical protein
MSPEKTQIANLIKLAKVDGELDHKEVMLIYGIAHRNGLSKFEMDEIIQRADQIETTVPTSDDEKIRYFYQLLILSTVDFEVSDDEVQLLTRVGAELRLDRQKVQKAINYAIENQSVDLTNDDIAGILN